ncbi:MAG: amidohydrolase family protein [Planctomycetota bacterium]
MNRMRLLAATLATACLAASALGQTAFRAAKVYLGDGEVIENGVVLIEDGRVQAVGKDVRVPRGVEIVEIEDGSITPGLIDANASIERRDIFVRDQLPGGALRRVLHRKFGAPRSGGCDSCATCPLVLSHDQLAVGEICPVCTYPTHGMVASATAPGVIPDALSTEAASEVVAHTRVLDALNLRSEDFDRLLLSGVTTVLAMPDSSAVIGPQAAILRTSGPLADRVLDRSAGVKAVIGPDPYSTGLGNLRPFGGVTTNRTRRPTTRMGVVWVFRKAFYDVDRLREGAPITGADSAPPEAIEVVGRVRDGDMPLLIQARSQNDIEAVEHFAEEFGLAPVLLEATEAHKSIDALVANDRDVVYGPLYVDATGVRSGTGDTSGARLGTLRALFDAGLEPALSAQDLRDEAGLDRQAMAAMKSGLSRDQALRSVTANPARILGIEDEVGTLERGKRADLVVWSGEPFAATSRAMVVAIDGRIVLDRRD